MNTKIKNVDIESIDKLFEIINHIQNNNFYYDKKSDTTLTITSLDMLEDFKLKFLEEKILKQNALSDDFKNINGTIIPVSYFNFKSAVGLVKNWEMNDSILKSKENLGLVKFKYIVDFDDNIKNKKNGDLSLRLLFNVYLPFHNFKPNYDEKNLQRLHLTSASYNANVIVNVTNNTLPNEGNKEYLNLSLCSQSVVEKINLQINEFNEKRFEKMSNLIKDNLLKISETNEFKDYNFEALQTEYDFDSFFDIPKYEDSSNMITKDKYDIFYIKMINSILDKISYYYVE